MTAFHTAGSATGSRPKILVILHQETSSPGRVGQILQQRGCHLDIRRPRFGDSLPHDMDQHAGAIIFGGPMSANDPEPGIRREIDWLDVPLKAGAPFLGICLGAQMLARHLGARVAPREDGVTEIGYYRLHPTEAGRSLMDWPAHVYQWHGEGFDLPAGAELLATGDAFRNQAYRYGPAAFGIQFHAELTYAMMNRWTVRGSARMSMPGAQARRDHFAGRAIHDAAVRRWLEEFLDRWLASGAASGAADGAHLVTG
ncbi:glutamine amidotransferase [Methylobrevis pamukkalensis]|uniref:Glutamine amidotransferase n=1 Tax=Methylobrevis pamukkalensis TaxID=1439726 RepID=A0A1E3H463_9HYPH|nr:glutamine amidotransferase [Methylobrevis pamukkalensis]ODN71102.1 glutamine amidotransferase [Methylobrevis pamukkalensis]